MDKFAGKYRIPSARASWWDYASDGAYFVTICAANHECYFGEIVNGEMIYNEIGNIANQYWLDIPSHFPFVTLGAHIVMPNHVHGIVVINRTNVDNGVATVDGFVETHNYASLPSERTPTTTTIPSEMPQSPTKNKFGPQSKNLASIIRGYKSAVKTYATTEGLLFAWQSRFHDHIIRDDAEYRRIEQYIITNPQNWGKDKFYRG